ncbi:MAG: CidA/LrgA family protein [Simplicispira sp.]|nr:CidA/LrgA family protein [Simplicispira sp.]
MIYALTALLVFQFTGELAVRALGLPLPGALVGMLLLFAALLRLGRVPEALGRTTGTLLQHMMLLFIPAIAGVMLHFDRVAREWQPFLVASVVGAAVTLVVTALTLKWLLRTPRAAQP